MPWTVSKRDDAKSERDSDLERIKKEQERIKRGAEVERPGKKPPTRP